METLSLQSKNIKFYYPSVMKKILILLLFAGSFSLWAQKKTYEPTWESLATREYPNWFMDAKLGIFIHWGVFSVPSWSSPEQYAEWFLRGILTGDTARIHFQERAFGKNWDYKQYAPLLKAELFDASQWADLFEKAGARYVILVSKHHDGYCLFPSKYAPNWNSMEVGPKRDIVGELSSTVKAKNMKMGLYYSLPEWNSPLYRWGTDKPEMVTRYVDEHMIPQFKEVVSTYKPSIVFADGEWDHPASTWHSAELIAWYYNLVGDEAIVNERWGAGCNHGFKTPEYSSGLVNSSVPWAEVRGIGRSFGLNRNEDISAYLTPQELVHFFVKAVANGGGITLNVGPGADGQIPLLQQERLLQLGSWIKVNQEAIYGSKAYKRTTEEKDVEVTRIDPQINFDWVRNSPAKGITEDDFTATWTGYVQPKFSEEYTFEAQADDGIRVWVDNQLVVDQWNPDNSGTQSNVMEAKAAKLKQGAKLLMAGKKYTIKVDYFEGKQNASAFLYWQSKNQKREIVPLSCLFTDEDSNSGNGLFAIYKSKGTRLCYTQNNGNIYAIALEWPQNNRLILNIEKPAGNAQITLLGTDKTLPWKYENNRLIVDLSSIGIADLPCQWAWTFRIGN